MVNDHNKTISTVFEAGNGNNKQAIYIPTPPTENNGKISYLRTFNAVADSPAPSAAGHITDMEQFSKSLSWPDDAKKKELYIKAPGTGFYIPPEYEQFMPVIEQMVDNYYKKYGDDGYCVLAIHQAIIEPVEGNDSAYFGMHKDINMSRINKEKGAPNCLVQVASDALPTGFSDYRLSEEEIKRLEDANDPDKVFQQILKENNISFKSFEPGTIVSFDAAAIHALANPQKATRRTVVITAFSPSDETAPENFLNPYLEAAVRKQEERNSFPLKDTATQNTSHI